jgi:ribosome assembly protein 4
LNGEGQRAGSQVDLSVDSTSKQLELLVNSLLTNEEQLPYAFYIDDFEVSSSLRETLKELSESGNKKSFEETLNIVYQPLSVFRVRPVTRCLETMPGHTDAVIHVSYSPDGKRLASGGGDMSVRFWNVSSCMPIHTCVGHKHHVLCTGWSANGAYFVSADKAGEIRVWNPITGQPHTSQTFNGHKKWVTALAFEPFHADPSCTRFASSSKDHTIKVWNINTASCEATICGHTDSVECIKWGGAGLLYSGSRDRTIKVWEIDSYGRSQHKLIRFFILFYIIILFIFFIINLFIFFMINLFIFFIINLFIFFLLSIYSYFSYINQSRIFFFLLTITITILFFS